MNHIKNFVSRYKWVLSIVALALVSLYIVAIIELNKLGHLLDSRTFTEYVAYDYMTAQRRKNKEWPKTLNELPRYIKAQKSYILYPNAGTAENNALKFYNEDFVRFEVLKVERNRCSYRLYFNDTVADCISTVHPDEGWCKY